MLDNVLNIVKDTVSKVVTGNSSIPDDKKDQTVQTATQAVGEGLKENLHIDNLSNVLNMFNGGSSLNTNSIVSNIVSKVTNALVQKVGLSQSISNTVANAIVPAVMKIISGKVNDPNDKNFDANSLINAFTGNNATANNIVGAVGKLFGK